MVWWVWDGVECDRSDGWGQSVEGKRNDRSRERRRVVNSVDQMGCWIAELSLQELWLHDSQCQHISGGHSAPPLVQSVVRIVRRGIGSSNRIHFPKYCSISLPATSSQPLNASSAPAFDATITAQFFSGAIQTTT